MGSGTDDGVVIARNDMGVPKLAIPSDVAMKPNTYDLRQFQEDLAALDRMKSVQAKESSLSGKEAPRVRLANAQADFLALRQRYGLTVADVVAFFPEDEGVAYLQSLIAAKEAKGKRRAKSSGLQNR